MRAYLVAGLVSLSITSAPLAVAQEPLWFTPPGNIAQPDSKSAKLSFGQRFGDLLSKPGVRTSATSSEAIGAVVPANSNGPIAATSHLNAGSPASSDQPFSFDQLDAASRSKPTHSESTTKATRGLAVQVAPIKAQVSPMLVQKKPSAAAPKSNAAVAQNIPWRSVSAQLPSRERDSVKQLPAHSYDAIPFSSSAATTAWVQEQPPKLQPPASGARATTQLAPPRAESYSNEYIDQQRSASDRRREDQRQASTVVNHLSDRSESPQPLHRISPVASSSVGATPLLNTESMIGPLQDVEGLFARLDLHGDLRDSASLMTNGPRGDAMNFEWLPAAYTWISPVFYHHPLYFEQPNSERYGIGRARIVQPLLSSAHFFGSIPLVPYKTLTHHPREKVYTLGQGRPGNCVPVQRGVILGQSTLGEVSLFWEECSGYR